MCERINWDISKGFDSSACYAFKRELLFLPTASVPSAALLDIQCCLQQASRKCGENLALSKNRKLALERDRLSWFRLKSLAGSFKKETGPEGVSFCFVLFILKLKITFALITCVENIIVPNFSFSPLISHFYFCQRKKTNYQKISMSQNCHWKASFR